jgi:uncharacterized protein (UPF0332 family)
VTAEQAVLLEKARSSLAAARLLVGGEFPEYAVGRAYFAMFYAAQALLLGEAQTFSKHAAVIAEFGKTFVKTGKIGAEYHRYLIKAQESRNVGDYDARTGLSARDAEEQIGNGERFLAMAESYLSGGEKKKE